jgi:hypothetical protein
VTRISSLVNLLGDTLQWLCRAVRIERILLFAKTEEGYEIACDTADSHVHAQRVSLGTGIERALNGRTDPVMIRWERGIAHVSRQALGRDESTLLAEVGAHVLLGLGADGFLCLARKAGDAPMDATDFGSLPVDSEMQVAQEVQNRIFPSERPIIPGLDYYGDWRPARGVSGDYLDYFEMDEGNLGLAVGDVSGKGLPAALLTSSLHSIVRALRRSQNTGLQELVEMVDELFYEVCPDNCYATLFLARYDPIGGRLHYVNAGHEPPFVLRKRGNHYVPIPLESGGPVIGLLRQPSYREGVVSLNPGDLLVAYTDGLCETKNTRGEEWGWRRLVSTIEANAARRARDIVEDVMETAEDFAGGAPPFDDMTLWLGRVEEAVANRPLWSMERMAVGAAA